MPQTAKGRGKPAPLGPDAATTAVACAQTRVRFVQLREVRSARRRFSLQNVSAVCVAWVSETRRLVSTIAATDEPFQLVLEQRLTQR